MSKTIMEVNMENKIAFSIKKYNAETKKTSFYRDVEEIFLQNILFKIDNFAVDLELENEMKIDSGLDKFHNIYNRKSSSISNQNFIITFSVLNENFFNEINLNEFQQHLYNILNSYFDILSFVVAKDNIEDITFYVICTATVKKIFLDHITKKVIEQNKNPLDLVNVLSYNLILGGTISEKPEIKFIKIVLSELNTYGYSLTAATEAEKQKYILESYNRASAKIQTIYNDINALIEHLISQNPKFKPYLQNLIKTKNLDTLKEVIKK